MGKDRKFTVFIIDDDPTNLAAAAGALEDQYDVLTFNSGPKLLKVLEKNVPDLIVLDVGMPDMDGHEVIRVLKSNVVTAHIPVIFLTGLSAVADELEGLSLGAVDFISKYPISPARLRKRVEIHLLLESQKKELIRFNNNLKEMVEAKTKAIAELQNAILTTMAELVERRDDTTGGHIERTQHHLSVMINKIISLGLYHDEVSSWDIDMVLRSAQLHDVGKIQIKDEILLKPDKLTEEEFSEIKNHALFGEVIIEKIKQNTTEHAFLDYAKIFASTHHEKWDGSGYPHGLKGEEIPLLGRIMAIVDVYDALISERPYKVAQTKTQATQIILEGKGTHFDPALIDVFMGVVDEL
jgi:putative two-component system response regulator